MVVKPLKALDRALVYLLSTDKRNRSQTELFLFLFLFDHTVLSDFFKVLRYAPNIEGPFISASDDVFVHSWTDSNGLDTTLMNISGNVRQFIDYIVSQ